MVIELVSVTDEKVGRIPIQQHGTTGCALNRHGAEGARYVRCDRGQCHFKLGGLASSDGHVAIRRSISIIDQRELVIAGAQL